MKNNIYKLWRSFLNNKNYNIINILGLSLGILSVLVAMLWVQDELSFDTFNKNADQIYRILAEESHMDGFSNSATTMPPLAEALKNKLPEVEKAANFEMDWRVVVKAGDNYLNEEGMAMVSSDFFDMFSFPFIEGSPRSFKSKKEVAIVSEKAAKKYFGEEDPLEKYIEINRHAVKIVAVIKDIDYNSHISFDLAIPEELGNDIFHRQKGNWNNQCLYTYIEVAKNVNPDQLASKIHTFIPDNIDKESQYRLLIQPLREIHFQKNIADEDYTRLGDKRYVYIFTFIGLFILLLACINFINLSTAVSENDLKIYGLKKILGAEKSGLIFTIIKKSLVVTSLATVIALLVLYLILPAINSFSGKSLSFDFLNLAHIAVLGSIIILTTILSGIYPAFYLASFTPVNVLKKNVLLFRSSFLRNGLVVAQFSISIILIAATIISSKQLNFIQNVNLGFDKQKIVYLPLKTGGSTKYQALKEKLLQLPGITSVAGKNYFSSTVLFTAEVDWQGRDKNNPAIFSLNQVDNDFIPLLKLKMLEGRNFSDEIESDKEMAIIINKQAEGRIGRSPIGMTLKTMDREFKIIGVTDNANFKSVNEKIQPEFYIYSGKPSYVFLKYDDTKIGVSQLMGEVRNTIKSFYPEAPFEYYFLDSTYAKLYENDRRVKTIFAFLAAIAIVISCMGLWGLISFSCEKRTKEIGIRKVNGAKILEVMNMLNTDFLKWVAIAFIIAIPVAWYAMHKWLESFAYKTNLSWWIFALAGILALGIALLTVSWQSWRAATRNPVEALRYE
ncbi:ABC transporter permease [Saccharicrinis sp. FJH62]|uniref:ABC transporter permease n=1 Tax=Saccharicrinis sp. FJH62 TaxID=3344657 RepID=UPI0035D438FB